MKKAKAEKAEVKAEEIKVETVEEVKSEATEEVKAEETKPAKKTKKTEE